MSNYSRGIYILQIWASAAGVNPQTVTNNYLAIHGKAGVESLGALSKGLNFGVVKEKFIDAVDDGASKENPDLSVLNTALLQVGGTKPSVVEALGDVSVDLGIKIFDGAKIILLAGIVIGAVYLVYNGKQLLGVLKNAK